MMKEAVDITWFSPKSMVTGIIRYSPTARLVWTARQKPVGFCSPEFLMTDVSDDERHYPSWQALMVAENRLCQDSVIAWTNARSCARAPHCMDSGRGVNQFMKRIFQLGEEIDTLPGTRQGIGKSTISDIWRTTIFRQSRQDVQVVARRALF